MKKVVPVDAVLIPDKAKLVFKGQIFDVYQWQQEMFDGSKATFEMLKRPDTVTVIPIIGDRIITIDDTQPHLGTKLGFPGGRVDAGEQALVAIKREMLEETGYEMKNWRLVKVIQPHFKLEWFINFYVAWDGQKVSEPHLDVGEKIKVSLLPFEKVKHYAITKSGYFGEAEDLLVNSGSLDKLKNLAEFSGQEVDR